MTPRVPDVETDAIHGVVNGRRLRVTIDATGAAWTVAVAGE